MLLDYAKMGCDRVVCCLGFLSLVPGMRQRLVRRLAFCPPSVPGYMIQRPKRSRGAKKEVRKLSSRDSGSLEEDAPCCCLLHSGYSPLPAREPITFCTTCLEEQRRRRGPRLGGDINCDACWAKGEIGVKLVPLKTTRGGGQIYAFHFKYPEARQTIIVSHGNCTDLGWMYTWLTNLCRETRASVLAYDYDGYGCTTGAQGKRPLLPTEASLTWDLKAAYNYLVERQLLLPKNIVLYGQSVGSAPSIDLARQLSLEGLQLGGLILHSPIRSGLSVLRPEIWSGPNSSSCISKSSREDQLERILKNQSSPWFDAFRNIDKIKDVRCPVFVFHGDQDRHVSVLHGRSLHHAAPFSVSPWWVRGAGHDDIELRYPDEYYNRIRSFLDLVNKRAANGSTTRTPWAQWQSLSSGCIRSLSSTMYQTAATTVGTPGVSNFCGDLTAGVNRRNSSYRNSREDVRSISRLHNRNGTDSATPTKGSDILSWDESSAGGDPIRAWAPDSPRLISSNDTDIGLASLSGSSSGSCSVCSTSSSVSSSLRQSDRPNSSRLLRGRV